MNQDPVDLFWR